MFFKNYILNRYPFVIKVKPCLKGITHWCGTKNIRLWTKKGHINFCNFPKVIVVDIQAASLWSTFWPQLNPPLDALSLLLALFLGTNLWRALGSIWLRILFYFMSTLFHFPLPFAAIKCKCLWQNAPLFAPLCNAFCMPMALGFYGRGVFMVQLWHLPHPAATISFPPFPHLYLLYL